MQSRRLFPEQTIILSRLGHIPESLPERRERVDGVSILLLFGLAIFAFPFWRGLSKDYSRFNITQKEKPRKLRGGYYSKTSPGRY
jgi:hypothetical protein